MNEFVPTLHVRMIINKPKFQSISLKCVVMIEQILIKTTPKKRKKQGLALLNNFINYVAMW